MEPGARSFYDSWKYLSTVILDDGGGVVLQEVRDALRVTPCRCQMQGGRATRPGEVDQGVGAAGEQASELVSPVV